MLWTTVTIVGLLSIIVRQADGRLEECSSMQDILNFARVVPSQPDPIVYHCDGKDADKEICYEIEAKDVVQLMDEDLYIMYRAFEEEASKRNVRRVRRQDCDYSTSDGYLCCAGYTDYCSTTTQSPDSGGEGGCNSVTQSEEDYRCCLGHQQYCPTQPTSPPTTEPPTSTLTTPRYSTPPSIPSEFELGRKYFVGRDIIHSFYYAHPVIRRACRVHLQKDSFYTTYLRNLSRFDADFPTYVKVLQLEDTNLLRELKRICAIDINDVFCELTRVVFPAAKQAEKLIDLAKPGSVSNLDHIYKNAFTINFIWHKKVNPDMFTELEPKDEKQQNETILEVIGIILSYFNSMNYRELAKYAEFLPRGFRPKRFCNAEHICLLAKAFEQLYIFLDTTATDSRVKSVGGKIRKLINSDIDYGEVLRQRQVERILEIVTRHESTSINIAIKAKQFLKDTISEMKNEFTKTLQNRFAELKSYFISLHSFNQKKANADITYIRGEIEKFNSSGRALLIKVEGGLRIIIEKTLSGVEAQINTATWQLFLKSLRLFNPFQLLQDPGDFIDRTGDVIEANEALQEAFYARDKTRKLGELLQGTIKIAADVFKKLRDNSQFIEKIRTVVYESDPTNSMAFDLAIENFFVLYNTYTPAVTAPLLKELNKRWEGIVDESCEILDETKSSAFRNSDTFKLCFDTQTSIDRLFETYSELYEHQYDLVETAAQYIKALNGLNAASEMNTEFTEIARVEKVDDGTFGILQMLTAFSFLTYQVQTQVIIQDYCDVLEYMEGGIKPTECAGFSTDVSLLLARKPRPCTDITYSYHTVPSQSTNETKEAFLNLTHLYNGYRVPFKIPDSQWLIDAGWISEADRHSALFVRGFEVYLPSDSSLPHNVEVIAEAVSENQIAPNSDCSYILTSQQPLVHQYVEGRGVACSQPVQTNPYQTCPNGDLCSICPVSVGTTRRLYPSIYSRWSIQLKGYTNETIPNAATDLPVKIGLKLCKRRSQFSRRKRGLQRHHALSDRSAPESCCSSNQFWSQKTSACEPCPANSVPALGGYYCQVHNPTNSTATM